MVIESVLPEIDGGRFPITRTPGELVTVSADIFADGHDVIDAALQYRRDGDADWQYEPMQLITNDRWEAQFRPGSSGIYFYTLRGVGGQVQNVGSRFGKKGGRGAGSVAGFDDWGAIFGCGCEARELPRTQRY